MARRSSKGATDAKPIYDIECVPHAKRDLSESVLVDVKSRIQWVSGLPEMLQVCNEASRRRTLARAPSAGEFNKPLSLEYMADRLDTDDPLRGYVV